jgi:NAD(P)-dependent dehydrogenase (short-subunit alcohol dehydrogenase family)
MDNLDQWNPEIAQDLEDDLSRLSYLADLFARTPGLSFEGIGRISIKKTEQDPFGDSQRVIHFAESFDPGPEDFYACELKQLIQIAQNRGLDPDRLGQALARARLSPAAPLPDPDILPHAVFEAPVVAFASPAVLMSLDLLADGRDRLEALFGGSLLWLDENPGLPLARALSEIEIPAAVKGLYVHRFGLFTFGADPRSLYENTLALIRLAHKNHGLSEEGPCVRGDAAQPDEPVRDSIAGLRQKLSSAAGTPLLLRTLSNPNLQALAGDEAVMAALQAGPLTVLQSRLFGHGFLDAASDLPFLSPNNLLLMKDLGLVVTGQAPADLARNQRFACQLLQAAARAEAEGGMEAVELTTEPLCEPRPRHAHDKSTMFLGEVALVTGAASGIGRGCALSLLDRGAAVIGLDVNPDIESLSDSPAYLGMVCDLTDEAAVALAYETAVRTFGGLDMLVLNAGIFTRSALVENLEMDMWQRVMRINLDANVTILRESYPLLKLAPEDGRVLVNASRNVPAPGPGAAAYSTSKAGLTQLARVAALEWGADGIRVNMIHPHAVFDTGIWTDEVLKSRAEKYGISVKEYKTRNLLKVELTSHDIGELVCEMLGPVFSKTTGAQVPVDGGSDRVI